MRKHIGIFGGLALFAAVSAAVAGTITVNHNDDPVSASCPASCSLRQAIAQANPGDIIQFASTLTSPISLTQGELLINKALTITGPGAGLLTISANNASRVFNIAANVSIADLTIADGYNIGTAGSDGAAGAGGSPPSNGGAGSAGGLGGGACLKVANTGALVLDHITVRHCIAYGGSGGSGGAGGGADMNPMAPPYPGGNGGNAAAGGDATGGAILVYGSLSLTNSSVVDGEVHGGAGGNGAPGGIGATHLFGSSGVSGDGGVAYGGAIFVATGSLRITNSTVTGGSATGGNGGAGVTSTQDVTSGGAGGAANGGLIRVDPSATLADIEFSTLAGGQVVGGNGGSGIAPPYVGPTGTPSGNAISAGTTATALSSVIVDVQSGVSLCDGQVAAATGSKNLSEDGSCSGFTLPSTSAQLKSIDASATPAYMPTWGSPAINAAATCNDLLSQPVTIDQHDTSRPQPVGGACDLGAIEADYIFVDGFGN